MFTVLVNFQRLERPRHPPQPPPPPPRSWSRRPRPRCPLLPTRRSPSSSVGGSSCVWPMCRRSVQDLSKHDPELILMCTDPAQQGLCPASVRVLLGSKPLPVWPVCIQIVFCSNPHMARACSLSVRIGSDPALNWSSNVPLLKHLWSSLCVHFPCPLLFWAHPVQLCDRFEDLMMPTSPAAAHSREKNGKKTVKRQKNEKRQGKTR